MLTFYLRSLRIEMSLFKIRFPPQGTGEEGFQVRLVYAWIREETRRSSGVVSNVQT